MLHVLMEKTVIPVSLDTVFIEILNLLTLLKKIINVLNATLGAELVVMKKVVQTEECVLNVIKVTISKMEYAMNQE